ncbi:unnamed protein product, partial [Rotaria sp. Silwood1]
MMAMYLILNPVIVFFISLVSASVPRTDVTVSGISSGGAMATQLHIGYSKDISGCGVVAGPPYYCAGSGLTTAVCMTGPALYIFVSNLEYKVKYYASNDYIDDPSNIVGDPVYIFSGKYDKVAYPGVVKLNAELYQRLNATVKTNFNMPANHGFATESFGASCSSLNLANYINNCNFNLAYDMLNHLYGGSLIQPTPHAKTPLLGQMLMFDQEAFMSFPDNVGQEKITQSALSKWIQNNMYLYTPGDWEWSPSGLFNLVMPNELSNKKSITTRRSSASFDDEGFIYFPSACANGKQFAGDVFATKAGYLEIAELNDIIVIFPQVRKSLMLPINPMGCWDWWGYSEVYYATQKAPQMRGVK